MDRVRRGALLTRLIDGLKEQDSWCGETHLQKAVYILQILARVPMGYKFILYKHGPFSFDLRDELTALRADAIIALQPRGSYGPGMVNTEQAKNVQKLFPKTLRRYERGVEFAAKAVGAKGVMELEKLATALYVRIKEEKEKEQGLQLSVEDTARRLVELKGHIPIQEAIRAVEKIDRLRDQAKSMKE